DRVRGESGGTRVGPAYFATRGIGLRGGRDFRLADGPGAPPVVVINEEFARRYFGTTSPLGRRLRLPGPPGGAPLTPEVVGVVANGRHRTIGEEQKAALYRPIREGGYERQLIFLLARTEGDPTAVAAPLRRVIAAAEPSAA